MKSYHERILKLPGTVPELLFEKKGLIPALQQILTASKEPFRNSS